MSTIGILDPGPQTTVQDRGRFGQLRLGIPTSGPMDVHAFMLANRLTGNDDNAAVLECTLSGPRFMVDAPCAVAVTGAEVPLTINGAAAPLWTTLPLVPGDEVKLGVARSGLRCYVAFSGGIDVPPVLGSRSTYLRGRLGGVEGRTLRRGDVLALHAAPLPRRLRLPAAAIPRYGSEVDVRAVLGPQHDRFTARGAAALFASSYVMLPQSDRMGARLKGEPIEHASGPDIVSDGTALGSVQVPGDGQPIVLLLDRQSTGGYTKLATVCSFDIGRIAQLRPGQCVRFRALSVVQAHASLHDARNAMKNLILEEAS